MFNILRMGCDYHHEADFLAERKTGYDCYLALLAKTPCVIGVNGERKHFEANTFVLFNKKSYQLYGADGEEYIDDWIQFECDENFMSGLNLTFDIPVCMGDSLLLETYFKLICSAFFRCINNSVITDHLIKAMLADISNVIENKGGSSPHYSELAALRRDIYSNPKFAWSIEYMAKRLNVSRPYVQELYRNVFGKPCMSDVIESRIAYAKSLLTGTEMNIEEIAYGSGYSSAVHFSRQFRQVTGTTPTAYRECSKVK